jgi:glycosyltransferase involved in cell wall biosynthesis
VGDVVPYLCAADVLAAPSRNEGMGRALIEALALGVPVVGSRVGGIPSVLGEGEFGCLVPPDAPAALAGALGALLEDGNRRADLGARGRKRAEAFTVEVMTSKILETYGALVPPR